MSGFWNGLAWQWILLKEIELLKGIGALPWYTNTARISINCILCSKYSLFPTASALKGNDKAEGKEVIQKLIPQCSLRIFLLKWRGNLKSHCIFMSYFMWETNDLGHSSWISMKLNENMKS